jgi:hypothetical protein
MIQSKQIREWPEEARMETRVETQLETMRRAVLRALELRFPGLPPRKFVKRVEGSHDLAELKRWFDAALTTHDWESFAKTVNGSA